MEIVIVLYDRNRKNIYSVFLYSVVETFLEQMTKGTNVQWANWLLERIFIFLKQKKNVYFFMKTGRLLILQ